MVAQRLITISISAIIVLIFLASSSNAMALTASGTNISNQATVGYTVNSVSQTDITSTAVTFMVDAKVDLTVTGAVNINGTPGDANFYALKFTVTNTGNEIFDFNLAYEAGTTDFTATELAIHIDDGNGTWDGVGTDTAGTQLNDIAANGSAVVFLIGKIPATATNTQSAIYNLMASALLSDGSAIPAEATDVVTTKQYIYADGSGPHSSDIANDTEHSDSLAFVIQTAVLTITKTSSVIWDPVNTTTAPFFHIPGAIIEYVITVTNGTGASQADAIVITDTLNGNLAMPTDDARKFSAGRSIELTIPNLYSGNATALTDISDGDEATVASQDITVTGIMLTAGQSATVKIRAEIQ
ncbi:MAG: hypothetical protein L3J70_01030 [Gammaproteobacteria bacterium]|nr:hypothetical protein [Gammaproteobacteria bacterium]